jgi:hypothetical protein
MSLQAFFEHPLWSRLAAMHLHFLWQGLLIAWLYWTVVKLFAISSARIRYVLGMTGLAAMMLSTLVTFCMVGVLPRSQLHEVTTTRQSDGRLHPLDDNSQLTTAPAAPLTLSPKGRGDKSLFFSAKLGDESETFPDEKWDASRAALIATPEQHGHQVSEAPSQEISTAESESFLVRVLLGSWVLGVMLFGLRLLGGVGTVVWWRWSSLPIHDPHWMHILDRLSRELGLSRSPRLAVSLRANDAFSLGLFRPLIVLPAAWLMQLSPGTLESVLAHELAHIRRFDAWANLFQRVL